MDTDVSLFRGDLGVVIVNYRSHELSIRCIQSILQTGIARLSDVVVVDNNSPDQSVLRLREAISGVHVVEAKSNAGFGAGVNAGISLLSSKYVLVLNPDTYFHSNVMRDVVSVMDAQDDIGILGLDLINPDGTRQYSARRFYTYLDIAARRSSFIARRLADRIDHHLMKACWEAEKLFDAEWVMGTGFVVRRSVYGLVGGMDEKYFLYLEDVDLCARVWKAGYRVVALPGACLVHDHQRSSARSVLSFAGREHLWSMLLFARKFRIPIIQRPGVLGIIDRSSV